ncbi:hypothetical protein [Streptomyces melanogenes]|uniref:hypothetical protein n=1 Tax=Streptomyces melanogenes TaxID=67326 RepID=UPI00167C973C|nr:hypothetical protein [Streptomyces melanogenes]GGP80491.1 hypothetical protein GCM10010278_68730 [Streptomyces melanogenes]
MDTTHCTVDGWVEAIPAPCPDGSATFDLIVRPVDADTLPEDAPDVVYACTSHNSRITRQMLDEVQPGNFLHLTGTLIPPQPPDTVARFIVDALEVLDSGLVPVLRDMVLDRYGDYIVIVDADTDTVPVFTTNGQWVGLADNPDAITTLIDIHERVTGGDT